MKNSCLPHGIELAEASSVSRASCCGTVGHLSGGRAVPRRLATCLEVSEAPDGEGGAPRGRAELEERRGQGEGARLLDGNHISHLLVTQHLSAVISDRRMDAGLGLRSCCLPCALAGTCSPPTGPVSECQRRQRVLGIE